MSQIQKSYLYRVELGVKIIRNSEQILILKKADLDYFKVLSQHSPRDTLESHGSPEESQSRHFSNICLEPYLHTNRFDLNRLDIPC